MAETPKNRRCRCRSIIILNRYARPMYLLSLLLQRTARNARYYVNLLYARNLLTRDADNSMLINMH